MICIKKKNKDPTFKDKIFLRILPFICWLFDKKKIGIKIIFLKKNRKSQYLEGMTLFKNLTIHMVDSLKKNIVFVF